MQSFLRNATLGNATFPVSEPDRSGRTVAARQFELAGKDQSLVEQYVGHVACIDDGEVGLAVAEVAGRDETRRAGHRRGGDRRLQRAVALA